MYRNNTSCKSLYTFLRLLSSKWFIEKLNYYNNSNYNDNTILLSQNVKGACKSRRRRDNSILLALIILYHDVPINIRWSSRKSYSLLLLSPRSAAAAAARSADEAITRYCHEV